ncbi:response regulator [Granulicella sp. WH15]|uniref:response regulator n=1 Tax=Granulicella sp. WH15 TaxID=2602070 RepID=UPI00136754D8|nr:response regulator [Granulicella sp. WH15]QHN05054.1 response regulator [Granulicella sp. WH15]
MRRLLVVDDETLVADTLTDIFRKNGFEVRTAYSADTALEIAREFTPHLLLCDIDMPSRDGLELMSDIGRELPGCPILVLTGFYNRLTGVHERAGTLQQPVNILTKPCQPVELLREVTIMLATA